MRGREFLMKDAYSFDLDEAGARAAYNRMFVAYLRTFARLGLKAIPMRADTGPIGGDLSHEFIILADTGESQVFCDKAYPRTCRCRARTSISATMPRSPKSYCTNGPTPYAATDEMHDEAHWHKRLPQPTGCRRAASRSATSSISAPNIRQPMKADVTGPDGRDEPVHMGSYGIGPSRLVAAIIEAFHDDNGINWPDAVAPFDVGLINMKPGDAAVDAAVRMSCTQRLGECRLRRALRRHATSAPEPSSPPWT